MKHLCHETQFNNTTPLHSHDLTKLKITRFCLKTWGKILLASVAFGFSYFPSPFLIASGNTGNMEVKILD